MIEGRGVFDRIAGLLLGFDYSHPLRVGVDGIDAAGKTRFVANLVRILSPSGREVLAISLDGFHNPREVRYRQGALSPLGYYQDSFDLQGFREYVLDPLGPGGDCQYRSAIFDHKTDSHLFTPIITASSDAILLCDGIFLHRPELVDAWDFTIYLDIPFEVSLQRALLRDLELLGSADVIRTRYQERYIPAQVSYIESCQPQRIATVLIDNRNPMAPEILPTQ